MLPANPADAFELRRQTDNASVGLNGVVSNDTATHVTLTFTGGPVEFCSLIDGQYTLTAIASQINGGNFDGDGNGTVDTIDFNAFRTTFGGSNPIVDFDNAGGVGTLDFNQFRSRFGSSV